MTHEIIKNIPEFFRQFEEKNGRPYHKKSRKGIPINLSPSELRERAKKSAITRAKNRAKEFEMRGETLKIKRFDECMEERFICSIPEDR